MVLSNLIEATRQETNASAELAVATANRDADAAPQDLVNGLAAESTTHQDLVSRHASECVTHHAHERVIKAQIDLTARAFGSEWDVFSVKLALDAHWIGDSTVRHDHGTNKYCFLIKVHLEVILLHYKHPAFGR